MLAYLVYNQDQLDARCSLRSSITVAGWGDGIEQTTAMSGAKTEWRAARPGDLVRAVIDDRSADVVEGMLRLNLVAELGYVQVKVEVDGRWSVVSPSTVEVLRAGDGDAESFLESLGAAEEAGLLPAEWSQPGGSW